MNKEKNLDLNYQERLEVNMNLIDNEKYFDDVKRVADTANFEKYKNSSILITGASGLICSFLVDVLMYRNNEYNDNIKIYMLCRNEKKLLDRFSSYNVTSASENTSNLMYIIQDVCDDFNFDIDFDYIIHGASNTHPKQYSTDPVGTITTNIIGMNNILNYCKNHKPKRVFMMSSVEIYGENRQDTEYFDENYLGYINCNTARAGYPESKRLCEALCQSYISQYDLDIVIGRLSRVYGPTMLKDDSKALAQFIRNALNNEDIVLKSEGNQLYSYTHVADAVDAIIYIMNYGYKGEAYNIADKNSDIRLKDLASILASYNNKEVVFELPDEVERKGYSTATKAIMSSEKINSIGWYPHYTIEEGLSQTLDILNDMKEKPVLLQRKQQ